MAIHTFGNTSNDAFDITLDDMDDWAAWSTDNADALIEDYGSIESALKHACDGGLTMGGGAAPIFHISFAA